MPLNTSFTGSVDTLLQRLRGGWTTVQQGRIDPDGSTPSFQGRGRDSHADGSVRKSGLPSASEIADEPSSSGWSHTITVLPFVLKPVDGVSSRVYVRLLARDSANCTTASPDRRSKTLGLPTIDTSREDSASGDLLDRINSALDRSLDGAVGLRAGRTLVLQERVMLPESALSLYCDTALAADVWASRAREPSHGRSQACAWNLQDGDNTHLLEIPLDAVSDFVKCASNDPHLHVEPPLALWAHQYGMASKADQECDPNGWAWFPEEYVSGLRRDGQHMRGRSLDQLARL